MSNQPQRNPAVLWILVGVVGGFIFLGWLISFPLRTSESPFNLQLEGLKQAIDVDDSEIGGLGDFKDIIEAESAVGVEVEEEKPKIILTEDQIRYLEKRVFDDPVE